MKITDIKNLFVGINNTENFKVLINAANGEDALAIAESYGHEAGLKGTWITRYLGDTDMNFDCDYCLSYVTIAEEDSTV